MQVRDGMGTSGKDSRAIPRTTTSPFTSPRRSKHLSPVSPTGASVSSSAYDVKLRARESFPPVTPPSRSLPTQTTPGYHTLHPLSRALKAEISSQTARNWPLTQIGGRTIRSLPPFRRLEAIEVFRSGPPAAQSLVDVRHFDKVYRNSRSLWPRQHARWWDRNRSVHSGAGRPGTSGSRSSGSQPWGSTSGGGEDHRPGQK